MNSFLHFYDFLWTLSLAVLVNPIRHRIGELIGGSREYVQSMSGRLRAPKIRKFLESTHGTSRGSGSIGLESAYTLTSSAILANPNISLLTQSTHRWNPITGNIGGQDGGDFSGGGPHSSGSPAFASALQ